ncbi:TonB-dependent receptor [Spirosoma areae]
MIPALPTRIPSLKAPVIYWLGDVFAKNSKTIKGMKNPYTNQFFRKLMKISAVQLCCALLFTGMAWAHDTRAQELLTRRVTLDLKEQSIKRILATLEKAADVRFLYSPEQIQASRRATVNAQNETLDDVLARLLNPLQISYKVAGQQIVLNRVTPVESGVLTPALTPFAYPVAQTIIDRTITGMVKSGENGQGIPGANVQIKGTTRGTSTDANGRFSLSVPDENVSLVISSIGFLTQEISLGSRSTVELTLTTDTRALNEVLVVGYGVQQKRDVTGAISQVKAEDIKNLPLTGLDQALQGRAAGVQVTQNSGEPGGSVSVRIRGVGSFGNNEPLYVIDGFPTQSGLNAINPNDIESIEILKDASAAIYGSRASNGVVIVTTKRGKAGKLRVEVDAYMGVQSPSRKIDVLNGPEFATLANEAYKNSKLVPNPVWANTASQPSYDWQDAIFQNSPVYNLNLSLSGGTEKSRTAVTGSYFRQDGLIVGSFYDRFTFRANNDFDVSKRLRFGSSLTISKDKKMSASTDDFSFGMLQNAYQMHPLQPIYAEQEGSISPTLFGYQGYAHYPLTTPGQYYPRQMTNPLWRAKETNLTTGSELRMLGTFYGELELIEGLRVRSSIGIDLTGGKSSFFNPSGPGNFFGSSTRTDGREGRSEATSWNWINTLAYSRTFNKRHAVSALVGIDALRSDFSFLSGVGNTYPNNDIRALSAASAASRVASGSLGTFSLLSYIGRVTYAFDDKYLLAFNIRRDGSSRFGPRNRYGTFPSASVGWRISQEPFMKNVAAVSDLKLRASYGQVGNQNIGDFRYLSTLSTQDVEYSLGTGGQAAAPAIVVSNLGNPDIKWETTTQTDLGLDATFLQGKVSLTADYFLRKTTDMLVNVPVPITLGAPGNVITRNAGSMENSGIELALGYRKTTGLWKWSADVNFSTLQNKVTSLGGGAPINQTDGLNAGGNNAGTRTEEGQSIAYFWGLQTAGIFQNEAEVAASVQKGTAAPGDRRFADVNNDGKLDAKDRINLGNGLPNYLVGGQVKVAYGSFDFSALFQGQLGKKIANATRRQLYDIRNFNGAGVQNVSKDLLGRWTGPGTSTEIPKVSYDPTSTNNNLFSSYYIENGDFLRCRNIQLGYTLPGTLAKRIGSERVRVYVSAQNLFTLTTYSGYDPEIGSLNQNVLTTGFDVGKYPVARVFMVGLNLQF